MGYLGLGVMLNMFSGNEETVRAIKESIGKEIRTVCLNDDLLRFLFTDDTRMVIYDDGKSCCEHRYMTTNDQLDDFIGATLNKIEVREAPSIPTEYGDHEVQFLLVTTSKGVFTLETHNEHNGYYGGFWIVARLA